MHKNVPYHVSIKRNLRNRLFGFVKGQLAAHWSGKSRTGTYRKSSIKLSGAYSISDFPKGGSIERGRIKEGGLFKTQVIRIYLVPTKFFYPIFCRINIRSHGSNT